MNGGTEREGRVEVCFNRVWGTVCDDLFSSVDAGVICASLGFGRTGIATQYNPASGAHV